MPALTANGPYGGVESGPFRIAGTGCLTPERKDIAYFLKYIHF